MSVEIRSAVWAPRVEDAGRMMETQIPRNEIQICRNEIQAGRNKIQIRRNEIQIQNPSLSFAESSLINDLRRPQVTGADFRAEGGVKGLKV